MTRNEFINMEYEARAMVSEKQYLDILQYYSKTKKEKRQSVNFNTYYDYLSLALTDNHIVLRTRSISNKDYELTLKIKGTKGDTEFNRLLTSKEYELMRKKVELPDCQIKYELIQKGIDLSRLTLITDLKTERYEVFYKKYIIVIDKNYYRGRVDYNVEVEASSKKDAIKLLNKKFKNFGVSYKKGYVSKSKRAIYNLESK
jgi:uncharacterized protein YjbK